MRTRRVFRVTVAASAVSCAVFLAGCAGAEPTDTSVSAQRYFPKTAAAVDEPWTPTATPPVPTTEATVSQQENVAVDQPVSDGIPYGDVCTQVEEFRVALGEFTGQPATDQDAIDATIEFYRSEGDAAGMDEPTLNSLVGLLRDC